MKYPNIAYKIEGKIFPYTIHKPFTRFLKTYYKNTEGLVGCEIGVWNGNNARSILNFVPIKKLYLIDPYLPEYKITDNISENRKYNMKVYKYALRNLKKYINKCRFIKHTSEDAVTHLPKKKDLFDFVYIDGNHNYPFIKKDIELYYPLVKKGGVLGGHDYLLWNGVHKAVDELLVEKNLEIMGWCHDWWIIKT